MGIKPAMVSTPSIREVWKALVIYKATLHCIFLSSLRGYKREVLGNIVANIKTPINETFSIQTTLDISNVHSYNCYIRFGQGFDDT